MRFNFAVLILFIGMTVRPYAYADDAEAFIESLKDHYKHTMSINAFSLTHSYLGRSEPFQSWDFEAPTRYKAFKITDIDMEKQHYYQNVVHHYTGGLYFDEVHYQNDSESLRYERNGISLGKSAINQSLNSFNRYKNLTLMNLDFFAVRPLLKETDVAKNIDFKHDQASNSVTLVHRPSEQQTIEYVFANSPLRLTSVNNLSRKRIFLYEDYRTSNGYYFAHSLVKHYNGETIPSFITRIEKFEPIEEIEPNKLKLPSDFYRAKPYKAQPLSVSEIHESLFLITDSSTLSNMLFKVQGNSITVFGAPRSSEVSNRVIDTIQRQVPNKSIDSIFISHPYSDHISGILPFVERGVTILADAYTIKAMNAYPRFSDLIDKFKFRTLANKQIEDGVCFYVLESTRSKRQSFAYFAEAGIVFETDFLEVAMDNTVAKLLPSYSKQFIEFLKREKLKVNRIVGFHRNHNISPQIMDEAYNANTM